MTRCSINNLLPDGFPRRSELESVVREALADLDGGAWEITLRPGLPVGGPSSVAVELRRDSVAIAFASVSPEESRQDLLSRLKLFKLT